MAELEGRGSSHSLNSNSSLSSVKNRHSGVGKVASWAVSFERLLEDPVGVHYFTTFLKSEVSAENILFWQACEIFRKIPAEQKEELIREARSIYDAYLSSSASHAINIDDTARTEERDLENPTPEMFGKAQQQIFKLMKFDSYTRFVRSRLYQSCMLADVEGRPLPGSKSPLPAKSQMEDCQSPTDGKKQQQQQKKKVKPGKSLPFDVEDGSDRKKGTTEAKSARDKRREKRGSWGAELSEYGKNMYRYESQCSVRSTGSMELGSSQGRTENGNSSPREREPGRAERYCCVFLPDGTASLAPARPGLTVREMLSSLCEKRGFSLGDVIIYLQGKEKQPLSLDQDSSVLRDQQVTLELRVKFTLEVTFTGKPLVIVAKSSKTLQESLSAFLQKHNLRPQDAVVTTSGKKEPLNMSMNVFSLANMKLQLDRANGSDHSNIPKTRVRTAVFQERPPGTVETCDALPPLANMTTNCRTRNSAAMKKCDMDGLIELLSRAPCQVDDQRGLLTKEQLVIPDFLQLPQKSDGGVTEVSSGSNPPSSTQQLSVEEPPMSPTPAITVTAPGKESLPEPRSAGSADTACIGTELRTGSDTPTGSSTSSAGSSSTVLDDARQPVV